MTKMEISTAQTCPELAAKPPVYRVGSICYTRPVLINVFFWMLWGDLCLTLMESVVPRMVPLQLQALGASNAVIGILTGSIFSLMNWIMNPLISTASDRYRSRLGRRIPFILYPTPFLALCLILVGFSGDIVPLIQTHLPALGHIMARISATWLPGVGTLSQTAQITVGVLATTLICYKFFDLFPQCAYYYLFADVIPQQMMGTFICLFRIVGTIGNIVFHYWLLQYSQTHPRTIYVGCTLLYLVAFVAMPLFVKEGKYPPPPPKAANPGASLAQWVRDVFSRKFYWMYYLSFAAFKWGSVPFNTFLIIYAQKKLGMEPGNFGRLMALILIVQMPLLFAMGPIMDRLHPIRVCVFGYLCLIGAGFFGFMLVSNQTTFLIFSIWAYAAIAIYQGALSTLGPRLLPRARYGQFCAANMMVVESGMLIFSFVCGLLLDFLGEKFIYAWLGIFCILGLGAIILLLRDWRRLGGDFYYQPPGGFDPPSAQ